MVESVIPLTRRMFVQHCALAIASQMILFKTYPTRILMKKKPFYDVIIVGGSYSGLAAAMALGRALRKVLVIDANQSCNIQTPHSHNFLTRDGLTPAEIRDIAKTQVENYATVEFITAVARSAMAVDMGFEVEIACGEKFNCSKLIFATGIKDILPHIHGFAESWGKSVVHCPYCHGYEIRHQKTGILANGEAAYELAKLISNWTDDLTLFTNGPHSLSKDQLKKLETHNIDVIEEEFAHLNHHDGYLSSISFKSGNIQPVQNLYTKASFIQHCAIPQAIGCELTQEGYLKIDVMHHTTVPGVFACGDNVTRMRTVANAVAMGTTTGMMVNKELIEERF